MLRQQELFLRISNPKTARFARRQHGRIDDPSVIALVETIFGHLQKEQKLFPASIHVFRKQWNAIMDRLEVPYRQDCMVPRPECCVAPAPLFYTQGRKT